MDALPTWLRSRAIDRVPGPWLLIYDGDCGFCRASVRRLQTWLPPGPIRYVACQAAEAQALQLRAGWCLDAVTLIDPDGRLYQGADVVPVLWALRRSPNQGPSSWWGLPGLMPGLRWGYRWVARHRIAISRLLGTTESPLL